MSTQIYMFKCICIWNKCLTHALVYIFVQYWLMLLSNDNHNYRVLKIKGDLQYFFYNIFNDLLIASISTVATVSGSLNRSTVAL